MADVTEQNFTHFKKLYNEAVRTEKVSFIFEGQEVLVSYAKYVVIYFEQRRAG